MPASSQSGHSCSRFCISRPVTVDVEARWDLWLIDWRDGVAYDVLLREKRGCGGVDVAAPILPALERAWQWLVHGDESPSSTAPQQRWLACVTGWWPFTPQGSFEQADCWRDLQDLGRTALTLLIGRQAMTGAGQRPGVGPNSVRHWNFALGPTEAPCSGSWCEGLELIVLPASKADPELYVTSD